MRSGLNAAMAGSVLPRQTLRHAAPRSAFFPNPSMPTSTTHGSGPCAVLSFIAAATLCGSSTMPSSFHTGGSSVSSNSRPSAFRLSAVGPDPG